MTIAISALVHAREHESVGYETFSRWCRQRQV